MRQPSPIHSLIDPDRPINFLYPDASPFDHRHLYVIFGESSKRVKIGRTTDIIARRNQLQANSPETLKVYAWFEWCGHLEPRLHKALQGARLHGEWFSHTIYELLEQGPIGPRKPVPQQTALWMPSYELFFWAVATIDLGLRDRASRVSSKHLAMMRAVVEHREERTKFREEMRTELLARLGSGGAPDKPDRA